MVMVNGGVGYGNGECRCWLWQWWLRFWLQWWWWTCWLWYSDGGVGYGNCDGGVGYGDGEWRCLQWWPLEVVVTMAMSGGVGYGNVQWRCWLRWWWVKMSAMMVVMKVLLWWQWVEVLAIMALSGCIDYGSGDGSEWEGVNGYGQLWVQRQKFIHHLVAPIIGLSFIPQLVNNICFCQLHKALNIGLLFHCCLS